MRPIPQTIEVARELARSSGTPDLLRQVQQMADAVKQFVPDCIGMSLSWCDEVTFTLVASAEEIAVLDALQYLSNGPCVDSIRAEQGIQTDHEGLFDEESWRLFAEGSAAFGVRSTLTFPLREAGRTVGSANLYGASGQAFEGRHEELADVLGAWAPGAVRNADLAFGSRRRAEDAPERLRAQGEFDRATGFIAARLGLETESAAALLREAAARADISPERFARAVLDLLRAERDS